MKKFEYRLLNAESGFFNGLNYKQLNEQLNQLGALGWEVVSTVGVVSAGQSTDLLFTLKREIK
jgi:hypothetical protein